MSCRSCSKCSTVLLAYCLQQVGAAAIEECELTCPSPKVVPIQSAVNSTKHLESIAQKALRQSLHHGIGVPTSLSMVCQASEAGCRQCTLETNGTAGTTVITIITAIIATRVHNDLPRVTAVTYVPSLKQPSLYVTAARTASVAICSSGNKKVS